MEEEADGRLERLVRDSVRAEVGGLFDDLRRFVDRRIAELSAEINATVQLVDFSEANLSGQLARIQEQIGRVVALPAAATRNSGLELEAVVQATESAANRIMEAAEAIGAWVGEGRRDPAMADAITEKVNAIFEACSFQDLTGQRVRRAIEHLQRVDTMLAEMVATDPAQPSAQPMTEPAPAGPDLAQDEIDRLLAG